MNYKLIVSDMDGTLLGNDHKITEENKEAIIKAIKNGMKFIPATGRMHNSAKEQFDFLESDTVIISCNGALIKDIKTDEVICTSPIDKKTCYEILEVLESHNIYYQMYAENTLICKKAMDEKDREREKRLKSFYSNNIDLIIENDLRKYIEEYPILKFIAIEEDNFNKFNEIKLDLKPVKDIDITSSWVTNIEIMKKGTNKASAIEYMSKYLDVNKSEIVAFGDNHNDIDMIKYVGLGVAMKNAENEVKEIADLITDLNSESGVAKVINDIL